MIKHPLTVDGVRFESVAAACRAYDLDPAWVCRLRKTGLSPEKAIRKARGITQPPKSQSKPVTVGIMTWPSVSAMLRSLGIPRTNFYRGNRK